MRLYFCRLKKGTNDVHPHFHRLEIGTNNVHPHFHRLNKGTNNVRPHFHRLKKGTKHLRNPFRPTNHSFTYGINISYKSDQSPFSPRVFSQRREKYSLCPRCDPLNTN